MFFKHDLPGNYVAVNKLIFAQTFAECYDDGNLMLKRSYKSMKLWLILFVSLGLFFSGCNYNMPREVVVENTNDSKPQKDPAVIEAEKRLLTDDPLVFSETSDFKMIPCNGREIEITEDATTSTYKLTGECKKITVDGVSNKVTVEKVGEIIVNGTSNAVIYGEGIDGKKPKITKTGVSTSVDSMQAVKKKQEAESKK